MQLQPSGQLTGMPPLDTHTLVPLATGPAAAAAAGGARGAPPPTRMPAMPGQDRLSTGAGSGMPGGGGGGQRPRNAGGNTGPPPPGGSQPLGPIRQADVATLVRMCIENGVALDSYTLATTLSALAGSQPGVPGGGPPAGRQQQLQHQPGAARGQGAAAVQEAPVHVRVGRGAGGDARERGEPPLQRRGGGGAPPSPQTSQDLNFDRQPTRPPPLNQQQQQQQQLKDQQLVALLQQLQRQPGNAPPPGQQPFRVGGPVDMGPGGGVGGGRRVGAAAQPGRSMAGGNEQPGMPQLALVMYPDGGQGLVALDAGGMGPGVGRFRGDRDGGPMPAVVLEGADGGAGGAPLTINLDNGAGGGLGVGLGQQPSPLNPPPLLVAGGELVGGRGREGAPLPGRMGGLQGPGLGPASGPQGKMTPATARLLDEVLQGMMRQQQQQQQSMGAAGRDAGAGGGREGGSGMHRAAGGGGGGERAGKALQLANGGDGGGGGGGGGGGRGAGGGNGGGGGGGGLGGGGGGGGSQRPLGVWLGG